MNDPDGGAAGSEPQLGRRARKALATRQAMFAAGLAAFENRPLGLVSVLDITEASDVAKGVFYLHFRGKDEYLIELWDFVRSRFLDALRDKLEATRARRARLEAVVAHYYAALVGAPRDCRFWLRMSSYFGDEVGQPGQMSRAREDYVQRLASLLAGVPPGEVGAAEVRVASVLDGASWGLISQSLQLDGAALDQPTFIHAVTSAVRALPG